MMSRKMRLRRLILSLVMLAAIFFILNMIQPDGYQQLPHNGHAPAPTEKVEANQCNNAKCECDTCRCCDCGAEMAK